MLAYNSGQEISLEQLSKGAGIAKNTLKRYIEYLQAAFLIKVVSRLDHSAKKFKRATKFKVYLTNPSMRAALFGPVNAQSEAMGALVETAIFAQWFHSEALEQLHYARWAGGEVDMVYLPLSEHLAHWCVEVKWSDLAFEDERKIKGLIQFLQNNSRYQASALSSPIVTSKRVLGWKTIQDVRIRFIPAAIYAYQLGANFHLPPASAAHNPVPNQ